MINQVWFHLLTYWFLVFMSDLYTCELCAMTKVLSFDLLILGIYFWFIYMWIMLWSKFHLLTYRFLVFKSDLYACELCYDQSSIFSLTDSWYLSLIYIHVNSAMTKVPSFDLLILHIYVWFMHMWIMLWPKFHFLTYWFLESVIHCEWC